MSIKFYDYEKKEAIQMKLFYKSLFRGWIEISEQQKENLTKYMNNGITALSRKNKRKYIDSKFIIE